MTSLRRHLASIGLAVVLCHTVVQVLVPAALCCEMGSTASKIDAQKECCAANAHPGKPCPMHKNRAGKTAANDRDCGARPQLDLHDLFIALTSGGILPSPNQLTAPSGSEAAPAVLLPYAPLVADAVLGPPPRA
jgi:hypothetical protein